MKLRHRNGYGSLILSLCLFQSAHADILDMNGATAGFGVADLGSYNWLASGVWSDYAAGTAAANDAGTASALVNWQGSVGTNEQAFFVGAGAGTTYTVRLGATGATDVYIQNLAINVNAAGNAALAGAAGNVTIGSAGDTANLIIRASNSVGAQNSGTLTINNGVNLNGFTMNYRGGNTVINGNVSGTAANSNITTGAGALGLTSGTLTLAGDNSFSGNVSVASGYTVILRHANALGATGGTNSVASGGAMEVANGVTIGTGESITINGDGGGSNPFGALRAGTGGGTWAGGVTIGATGTRIGATANNTLTITGTIADGAGSGLVISGQSGTGVVVLNPTTSNTYTGNTSIVRGILRLGKNDALNTATILDVDSANTVTDAASFDLAGFNQTVAGLQDSATSNINGVITNSSASTASTLTVNQASNTSFDGSIQNGTGGVALTKSGAGILTLNGANTFTGGTNIQNGRVVIGGGNDRLSTSGAVTLGSVANTGVLVLGDGTTARNQTLTGLTTTGLGGSVVGNAAANSILTLNIATSNTFDGIIGGAGTNENNLALTKSGAGTLTLTQSNTFTGNVIISAGLLSISHSNALGTGTKTLTLQGNSRRFELTNSITLGNNISLNLQTNTNAGVISSNGTNEIQGAISLVGGGASIGSDGTSTLTLSGNITANGGTSLNLYGTSSNNNTVSGVIANGTTITSLTKQQSGTWILSNANTFTGNTNVSAGTLRLTNNLAIQNSIFDTAGAGTLDTQGVTTPTFAGLTGNGNLALHSNVTSLTLNVGGTTTTSHTGNLSGGTSMALIKSGTGTQTLSGTNSYTGLTTVNGGELRVASSGAIGGSNVTVTSGQLTLDGGVTVTGKTITTTGSGTNFLGGLQSVTGINTWAGNVILGADNSRIGARLGATLILAGAVDDGANSFNFVVRNGNTAATNGGGNASTITEISGVNTYGGSTTFIAGLTRLGTGNNRLPTGTVMQFGLSGANAKFDMNGFNQEVAGLAVTSTTTDVNRDWNANELTNSSGTLSTLTVNTATSQTFGVTASAFTGSGNYSGIITGNIALVKTGSSSLTLTATNSYTGGTRVDAGILALSHATNTLSDTGAINVNGGELALATNSDTVGAVTLSSGSITSTTGTLTGSSYDVRSGSISARLAGASVALTKSTAGTVTLTSTNTYTGATNVDAGKLVISSTGSTAAGSTVTVSNAGSELVVDGTLGGALTINSGAILSGSGTISGSTTIAGIHNAGNSPGIQTFAGDLGYQAGSTVNWELGGNTTTQTLPAIFDQIVVGGNLSFAATTTVNLLFNTVGSAVDWNNALWDSDQSWTIFDVAGTTTGLENVSLTTSNWADSNGQLFDTIRSDGFFTLSLSGQDVILNYTAVPETSVSLLGGLSALLLLRRKRR